MKTIYIVRHGKSSWDDPQLKDHDRPLMQKGIDRTEKISNYLIDRQARPDLMVSSSAKRALETAYIIAENLSYPKDKIVTDSKIYYYDSEYLMDLLFSLDDDIDSVMLFGHNPTFTNFSNSFLHTPIDSMPTSAVVSISFKTDQWNEISLAERITNFVVTPKQL